MTLRVGISVLLLAVGCTPKEAPEPGSPRDDAPAGDTGPTGGTSADDTTADSGAPPPSGDTGTTDTAEPEDSGVPEDSGTVPDASPYQGQVVDPPWSVPAFTVLDQHGEAHTRDSLVGRPTVLWFFRDTASSCTNDACGYRDLQEEFDALGVQIVGVGPTTVAENAAWAEALDYHYGVWSDAEGALAVAFEVESTFDEGNLRHAFLIDDTAHTILRYEGAVSLGADPRQVLADATVLYGTGE